METRNDRISRSTSAPDRPHRYHCDLVGHRILPVAVEQAD